ncbi:MAG: FAD-dependent oxidoreductase [Myxococcota bacterium]|nr:FAD-dependent oxidoreductase [Myxococcota bacterium]
MQLLRDASSVTRWDREVDVVVIGLGCAGAAVALEASRVGAQVLVFECASGGGGTSAMSGGVIYLGGGTSIQTACGFEDSAEDMFAYLMASCGPRPDEEKIRAYAEGSVEHFEWFVRNGVPFKPVFYPDNSGEPPTDDGLVFSGSENAHPYRPKIRPAPRGHVPQVPDAAGGFLMQKLLAAVAGSEAELVCDARCEALFATAEREVLGVAVRIDGREHQIRARGGVVLATGGFINNREMIREYAPQLENCSVRVGAAGDNGSGIRLGAAVGAAAVHMGFGSISLPIIPPRKLQKGILINAQGQRFINEDSYYGVLGEHALYRQNGRAYLVLDDETFERPKAPREVVATGESARELEQELGLPAGSFEATLELYNRYAEKGEDPVFNKAPEWVVPLRPPLGALDCTAESSIYAAFTLGGLRTSAFGEVLTPDASVIPGLYAAGRTTACLAAPGYSSGLSIGDGTFFGRRAGLRAAARAA